MKTTVCPPRQSGWSSGARTVFQRPHGAVRCRPLANEANLYRREKAGACHGHREQADLPAVCALPREPDLRRQWRKLTASRNPLRANLTAGGARAPCVLHDKPMPRAHSRGCCWGAFRPRPACRWPAGHHGAHRGKLERWRCTTGQLCARNRRCRLVGHVSHRRLGIAVCPAIARARMRMPAAMRPSLTLVAQMQAQTDAAVCPLKPAACRGRRPHGSGWCCWGRPDYNRCAGREWVPHPPRIS